MKALGRHLLLELYECEFDLLNDLERLEKILVSVVNDAGATLIDTRFHRFSPYGVSGVVVIAESHITIHTWPEHNYAAIDVFTCDHSIDYEFVERILVERFEAGEHETQTIGRGKKISLPQH